jgi:phage gp46-like protein
MDIALAYNPAIRGCDVVFNGTDFALDSTPASAMLFSLLANRRAAPDDKVSTQVTTPLAPQSFTARGGYPGDALDQTGQLAGSRLWLLQRALADEQTRIDAQNYVAEALSWLETVRGQAVQIAVRWFAPDILAYRAIAGATTLQLKQAVGG